MRPIVYYTSLTQIRKYQIFSHGNLVYRKTAQNFNPMMASAAKITVAEVEELVDLGQLDPDRIDTPGIFVTRVVVGESREKRIERLTVQKGAK